MLNSPDILNKLDKDEEEVNLKSCDLNDDTITIIVKQLITCNSLQFLDLSSNKLTAKSGKIIAELLHKNKTILALNLTSNHLGDEGASDIASAIQATQTLIEIRLYGNQLTSKGGLCFARLMTMNCSLTSIDLSWNALDDSAGIALAQALTVNKKVRTLNLQCNTLGVESGKAFATALRKNQFLTSLNLQSNKLGVEGVNAIIQALKVNRTLDDVIIYDNQLGPNEIKMRCNLRRYVYMNHSNYKLLIRYTLLFGFHHRCGQNSALRSFYKDRLFDKQLFKLILEFEGCFEKPSSVSSQVQAMNPLLFQFEERMMSARSLDNSIRNYDAVMPPEEEKMDVIDNATPMRDEQGSSHANNSKNPRKRKREDSP